MIAGYVTYQEIRLITGLPDKILKKVLAEGIKQYSLNHYVKKKTCGVEKGLYNLAEVEKWFRMILY